MGAPGPASAREARLGAGLDPDPAGQLALEPRSPQSPPVRTPSGPLTVVFACRLPSSSASLAMDFANLEGLA